jgi:hypothetical protein
MPDNNPLTTVKDGVALVGEIIKAAGDNPNVKEAGNNLGQALVRVTNVIKNLSLILEPINFAGEKARIYFQGKFQQDIGEKVAKIPEEDIVEPKASIAGPVLQGLTFTHEEQSLKDMYLNLLATAMDGRVATTAHPAFVEIIKQLDGKDAALVRHTLQVSIPAPIVQLRLITPGQSAHIYQTVATHLLHLLDDTENPVEDPELPAMIDNWTRLGLVEVDYSKQINQPTIYDWVETRPEFIRLREKYENEKVKLIYQKGMMFRTQFGQRFAAAVGLLSEHELSITGAGERE